jgi:hypothetical protein
MINTCKDPTLDWDIVFCYTNGMLNKKELIMQNTLTASLSANYVSQFEDMYNSDTEIDMEDIEHELITRFEQEFAEYLRGCDSEDVGGVVLYLRGGEEVAFFDYENFHGSVYELGHKRASETSIEWAERVGAQ